LYIWIKSLSLNFIYLFLHTRTISGISFLPQPKKMNSDSDDIIDPNLIDYEDEEGNDLYDDQGLEEEGDFEEGNDFDNDDKEIDEDFQGSKKISNGKRKAGKSNKRNIEDDEDNEVGTII